MIYLYEKVVNGVRHREHVLLVGQDWNGVLAEDLYLRSIPVTPENFVQLVYEHRMWPWYNHRNDGTLREQCAVSSIAAEDIPQNSILAGMIALCALWERPPSRIVQDLVVRSMHNFWMEENFIEARAIILALMDSDIIHLTLASVNTAIAAIRRVVFPPRGAARGEDVEVGVDLDPPNPGGVRFIAGGGGGGLNEALNRVAVPVGQEEDANEMQRHYHGTYVKEKEKNWIYFDRVISGKHVSAYGLFGGAEKATKFNALIENLDFTPFKNGVYNTDTACVAIYKDPNRQWRRGFCGDTYRVEAMTHSILSAISQNYVGGRPLSYQEASKLGVIEWENMDGVLNILNQIEKNTYYPLDYALREIENSKRFSCAIDKRFWVMPGIINRAVLLLFNSTVLAEIEKDVVKVLSPMFFQEVSDFLRDSNSLKRIVL